ncbi:DNA-directed RNA polymerase subunit alpha C-terminal domain-containing protein [Prevotella corporis]|uniref:DNA-directed RNA polymerase subunit alpha C-terminal domain-containing protein n=1 Tax=Prevotella corporis TaxID=28128 RepID=UPI0023F6A4C3|nr:DNA-directed RNA polymerase subunit alpha C-terminal domain-containing protein [Prevotella corporis]
MKNKNNELEKILATSIYEVGFSQRVVNALTYADLKYIKDVVTLTEGQLLRVQNFGIDSLKEVKRYIDSKGLVIGKDYQ